MNLLKQIKEQIQDDIPVIQIKSDILKQDPTYNTYWVETEFVWYHLRTESVEQVSNYIISSPASFSGRWSIAKVQKFYNKLHGAVQTSAAPVRTVDKTEFDEDRTFGIEIEFTYPKSTSIDNLISEFINAGIQATDLNSLSNPNRILNIWKFTSDCSVHVASEYISQYVGGNELKSPILKGSDGIEQVRKVMQILKKMNCRVNNSCGFHVHHGFKVWKSVV